MNPVAGSREGDDETLEKTIRAVVPPVGGLVVGGTRRAAVYTANHTPVTGRPSQRAGAALPGRRPLGRDDDCGNRWILLHSKVVRGQNRATGAVRGRRRRHVMSGRSCLYAGSLRHRDAL